MKTSPFQLVAQILCVASACLAVSSLAHAAQPIKQLIDVAQLKAMNANDDALAGSEEQRVLVVQDIAAVADFESKASADGIDDAEKQSLAELVGVAQGRVDGATADASTEIASAKQQLKAASTAEEKAAIKLHLKSLRATAKAHKQTAAALRALAKKLAA